MSDPEDTCQSFVQMWTEAVMLQVERVRQIRKKADADSRAYEHMEDWSPTEHDLAKNFRAQWAEEQTLVWAAHQLNGGPGAWEERDGEPAPAIRYSLTSGTSSSTSTSRVRRG